MTAGFDAARDILAVVRAADPSETLAADSLVQSIDPEDKPSFSITASFPEDLLEDALSSDDNAYLTDAWDSLRLVDQDGDGKVDEAPASDDQADLLPMRLRLTWDSPSGPKHLTISTLVTNRGS